MTTPANSPNPLPIPSNQPPLTPVQRLLQQQLRRTDVLPTYILAIVPETGVLRHETFSDESELVLRLRALEDSGEEISISISVGYRLQISKPPLRYLVAPWGRTPLFDPLAEELTLEDDGFLGKRYDDLLPPATAPDQDEVDAEIAAGDVHDEDDEDDEEDDAPTVDDAADIFSQRSEDADDDGT